LRELPLLPSLFARSGRFGALLAAALFPGTGRAQVADLPCDPAGATVIRHIFHDTEGVFLLDGTLRVRLAQIVWPDHLEPGRRARLAQALAAAIDDTVEIRWKAAATPDRWGITPAHLFLREKDGARPPFWLQAGLVENGLVPAWPDSHSPACRDRLADHEASAIRARRGYWAPRAQAARHRAIALAPEAHAGRRLVSLWRVRNVRAWRTLHFVNFMPSFRGAPALALTQRQMAQLKDKGRDPDGWRGKWIVARIILGAQGLSRLRIETADHLATID
jgi:hypothetical protein